MIDTVIPIPVDAETTRVYHEASAEDQRKIQLLLRLRLRELAELPRGSLRAGCHCNPGAREVGWASHARIWPAASARRSK
jgi:hypothetical protein